MKRGGLHNATIRDVAREAAVSTASVSRALNGHDSVAPDTRARVEAAAVKLRYVPHAGARSLSGARTHAIGVILPDLHGEFFSEIVRGMDREAVGRGLQLLISTSHADAAQASQALRAMRGRVDGMIVMAPHLDVMPLLTDLPSALPIVLINCRGEPSPHPSFRIDNAAGVEAMVRHLAADDRRRIALIAGPPGNLDAEERLAAFERIMRRGAGTTPPLVIPGDFSEEAGAAAAAIILNERPDVDAVFATNDKMAIGCLLALRAAGVDVPGRIAVAGFDGIPVSRYLSLTTMHLAIAAIGAAAVARLTDVIEGRAIAVLAELHPPELVVRATAP